MSRAVLTTSLGVLVAFAIVGKGWSQERDALIPERFHGAWSIDLARCDDRESGLNLRVEATSLTYFEAGDTVLAVTPAESNGVHIQVVHEDYDGMETLGRTMILSDDLQTLTFTYGDGPDGVYLRCPTPDEVGEPDPDHPDTGTRNP